MLPFKVANMGHPSLGQKGNVGQVDLALFKK